MVQFEIKVKREERCKCIEFHLPALSRELLTTQEIFQKMDISFFLFLHTFFWNLCRIRYRLAQILPQLRSKKLVSGVYHCIYHSGAPSVERGREAVTRGNEIFFYSAAQRYNRISTWRWRKWKLSGHVLSPPPFYHIAQIETLLR